MCGHKKASFVTSNKEGFTIKNNKAMKSYQVVSVIGIGSESD